MPDGIEPLAPQPGEAPEEASAPGGGVKEPAAVATADEPVDSGAESAAGEEDPGASLGEAGTQGAMQGEAQGVRGGR